MPSLKCSLNIVLHFVFYLIHATMKIVCSTFITKHIYEKKKKKKGGKGKKELKKER